VCNCLRKDNYDKLMEAIREYLNGTQRVSQAALAEAEYDSDLTLAVVNLNGLSGKLIYADDTEEFQVRALLGKGLCLQREGTHIAFCVGPMSASFLDLVALLLKINLGLEKRPQEMGPGFKLVYYASGRTPEDILGLKLLEGLDEVTKEKKLENFKLVKCVGENSIEAWTEDLLAWEIAQYKKDISRIYVRGSPLMTEVFDKALSGMTARGEV